MDIAGKVATMNLDLPAAANKVTGIAALHRRALRPLAWQREGPNLGKVVDLGNAEQYGWGDGCWGWRLNKEESLSVIQEEVPPGKSEKLHFHRIAAQFFYILEGEAEMLVDGVSHWLGPWQGIKINPLEKHKFINSGKIQ